MLGTDLAILVENIKFVNTFFFHTYSCIVCTGQSPALPPPLPTEQASTPAPASPTPEGKYFIFAKLSSIVDKIECRETKHNSNSRNNKIPVFLNSFGTSKLQFIFLKFTTCFFGKSKVFLLKFYTGDHQHPEG